jgi:hypothetical protein
MEGERELTTGLIPKSASSRLIVTGKIGPKEIDTLLRKLAIDMDIARWLCWQRSQAR